MALTSDPFRQTPVDPPVSLNGRTGVPHVPPATTWPSIYQGQNPNPPIQRTHNTLAVLSAAFAVALPPVGAVLGHWALAQIRRTNEAGRTAAIWGLILGYSLTVALIAGLIVWAVSSSSPTVDSVSMPGATVSASPLPHDLPPLVVVTSVAPPPRNPRVKLDLSQVSVGTCAEIQKRDVGDDALDLFGVACEHRRGVYTVVARVDTDASCQSTYIAAPPDHSFALCLNEY